MKVCHPLNMIFIAHIIYLASLCVWFEQRSKKIVALHCLIAHVLNLYVVHSIPKGWIGGHPVCAVFMKYLICTR